MQGWMFGRDRTLIWDPQSVKALLDGAPDDKLLIVDLAVDFNEFVWRSEKDWDFLDGFSGKEWIWSTTPNFGGRSSLKGCYDFYLNAHLDALSSPNKGRLTGFGCSPEGIESNEALYEAVSSAGWSGSAKDARDFLGKYFAARYACDPSVLAPFVDGLLGSVYDNFTSGDVHDWARRPRGFSPNVFNVNDGFYAGIRQLLELSPDLGGNELYRRDAVVYAAAFLCAKADAMYRDAVVSFVSGDAASGRRIAGELYEALLGADRLLESHPLMRIQRWLDMADRSATCAAERKEFRAEALRLVTTWDAEGIHDYASRCWSGLLRDYYVPRLKAIFAALEAGTGFDIYAVENSFIDSVASGGLSRVLPYDDPVAAAASLVERFGAYAPEPAFLDVVGCWAPALCPGKNLAVYLSRAQMQSLSGFRFDSISGGPLELESLKVGGRRLSYPDGPACRIPEEGLSYRYEGPSDDTPLENTTPFVFRLVREPGSSGCIRYVRSR